MLRSDLCDFSDAYIVLKGDITVTEPDNVKRNKCAAFKNNGSFINYVSKTNGVQVDNAEDLDVVMPMHNLLEYKKITKKAAGSLCNYYRDEPSNPLSSNPESFKHKTSTQGNTYNVDKKLHMMMVMKLIILNMMQPILVKMKLKLLFH